MLTVTSHDIIRCTGTCLLHLGAQRLFFLRPPPLLLRHCDLPFCGKSIVFYADVVIVVFIGIVLCGCWPRQVQTVVSTICYGLYSCCVPYTGSAQLPLSTKKAKSKKKKRTNVVGALEHFGRRAQVCSAVQTLRYTAHHTVYIPRPLTYFKFRFRARLGIHGVRVRVRT